jgi:putative nucleotidyltransferase with HDIG domain
LGIDAGGLTETMRKPEKHKIAFVSGDGRRCRRVNTAAQLFYDLVAYDHPAAALAAMERFQPDVVLVDEQSRSTGGVHFLRDLRHNPRLAHLPVIILTAAGADAPVVPGPGAVVVLSEPIRRGALIKAVSNLINAEVCRRWSGLPHPQRVALSDTLAAFNEVAAGIGNGLPIDYLPVEMACRSVVEAIKNQQYRQMLEAVRAHDDYTFTHSLRVGTLLALFGQTIGLSDADMLLMASGGLLHDVGKIGISPRLLNKPGRLAADEMNVMRGHVDETVRLLKAGLRIPKGVIAIAANHHEKLDGSGYPRKLQAAQLDELARMSAIVDVFSAMTDRRPYKPALDAATAFKVIVESMATQLDTHLLALFRAVLLDGAQRLGG